MPPYPAPARRPGPSVAGYWVAGVLAVLTPVAAIAALLLGLYAVSERTDGFARAPVPGAVTVTVDEPQTLVIYLERTTAAPGDLGARVTVTGPDGAAVQVGPYDGELTYELGDRAGTALATFRADAPGRYTARGAGQTGATSSMAVGGDLAPLIAVGVLAPFVIGAVGVALAVGTAIVTYVRRSSASRRPAAYGFGYPYGYHDPRFGPR
jgi:hypothetical protein